MDSRRRAGPRPPPTYRRSLVMTRSLRNGRGSVRRNELRSQAARHPASPSARSLLETTAPWRRRVVGRSPQIQPWAMPRARGLLLWQTRQYWSRSMFWEDPPAPGKVEVEERRLGRRRPDEDQPPAIYIVRRRRESGTMALAARFAARTMVVLSDVVAGDCPCFDRAFGKMDGGHATRLVAYKQCGHEDGLPASGATLRVRSPGSRASAVDRQNSLTMVLEERLHLFQREGSKQPILRVKHFYNLPWPHEVLEGVAFVRRPLFPCA